MKKHFLLIAFLLPGIVAAQDDTQRRKDSLRNVIAVTEGVGKLVIAQNLCKRNDRRRFENGYPDFPL